MAPESSPILEVKNLTVQFGGLKAVDNVNFTVRRGELLAIIGPNGAGKSTTFNAIAGVFAPTEGEILFENAVISGLPPGSIARKGIGRTFQLVRLFKSMTVLENVTVACSTVTNHLRDARQRAMDIVDLIGLKDRAYQVVNSIPLADQKKTEIARALGLQPKLLLLDEMMSGLNASETDEIVSLVRNLNADSGLTIVVIEHVLRVIMALSERIIVLDHGRVIAEGPPESVVEDPGVIEAYLGKRHAKTG